MTRVDGCDVLASPNEKRCDFLLFAASTSRHGHWVAPIELKSGPARVEALPDIRDQLQTGANVAADVLAQEPALDEPVRLRPVLGQGAAHPRVARILTRGEYTVTFQGRRLKIRAPLCGDNIDQALK